LNSVANATSANIGTRMSDELTETCEQARRYARQHPITQATISVARYRPTIMQPYCFRVTERYHCMLMYETFPSLGWQPPIWHAQMAVMENIGELTFGAVQQALVSVKDWFPDDRKACVEILGEALGAEIRTHDQDVHVHDGLWDMHMWTKARPDAEKTN
jgi:hypothetical protein